MIRMTIEATNFQELMEQICGITLGAVVAPAPIVEPVVVDDAAEELDSEGIVWNAEIHAPSKSKNKDGTWRAKRAPAPVVAAPVVAAPVMVTFNDLMALVSRKMAEGKITPAKLGEIQVQHGVENISMLSTSPEMIPAVYATVDAL